MVVLILTLRRTAMNELYGQVAELLDEHHEAEIGRLLGVLDKDVKLMVRDICSHITDWRPERVGDVWAIFSESYSAEYIDAEGNYQCFDTEAEALAYINAL
jgi:hypothetical protein